MTHSPHHHDPYPWLAPYYDWMARVMLVPFGGERAFRRRALDALDVGPGTRVLELGCGTGSMTRDLLARGARVTAVDLSEPMLARARRKAPGARFVRRDILSWEGEGAHDRVLLSFVLHEMDREIRARALSVAGRALAEGGLLGVLDFAGSAPRPVDDVFRAYLRVAEPEVAADVLEGLPAEVERGGFEIRRRLPLALGTARMLVARRR